MLVMLMEGSVDAWEACFGVEGLETSDLRVINRYVYHHDHSEVPWNESDEILHKLCLQG